MKHWLLNVFQFILILIIIDMCGWFMWALSGQFPPGNFYVGSLSEHTILWIEKHK